MAEKTEGTQSKDILTIKLVGQDANAEPIEIRAKRSTKLEKVIDAYAKQRGLNPGSLRLLKEGMRLKPAMTIGEIPEIEDGDQLDVTIEQLGGC